MTKNLRILLTVYCAISAYIEPVTSIGASLDCDFENGDACEWTQVGDDDDGGNWNFTQGAVYPIASSGPSADHTWQTQEGWYAFVDYSPDQTTQSPQLKSPTIRKLLTGSCLTFWYHMYGEMQGTLTILDDSKILSKIESVTGNHGSTWRYMQVFVTNEIEHVTIEASGSEDTLGVIAIDDVVMLDGQCPSLKFCGFEPALYGECDYDVGGEDLPGRFKWEMKEADKHKEGPGYDHTLGSQYGSYMFASVTADGLAGTLKAQLRSPTYSEFDTLKCLTFWYNMIEEDDGVLSVYVDDGNLFDDPWEIWTMDSVTHNIFWNIGYAEFTPSAAYELIFEFEVDRDMIGNTYYYDIAVDDIMISDGECKDVSGEVYQQLLDETVVPVWSIEGNQGDEWNKALIDLKATADYRIVIKAKVNVTFSSDIAIDDIQLLNQACEHSTTLMPTTTTVTSTPTNVATSTPTQRTTASTGSTNTDLQTTAIPPLQSSIMTTLRIVDPSSTRVSKETEIHTFSTTDEATITHYFTGQTTKLLTDAPINPTTDGGARSTLRSTVNKPVITTSESPSDGTIENTISPIISTNIPVSKQTANSTHSTTHDAVTPPYISGQSTKFDVPINPTTDESAQSTLRSTINKPVITTSESPSDGTIENTISPIVSTTIPVSKQKANSTYSTANDAVTPPYISGQSTKSDVPINPTTDGGAQSTLSSTVNKPVITTSESPSDGTIENTISPIISTNIPVSKQTANSTHSTTHDAVTSPYISGQSTKYDVPINPTTDGGAQSTLRSTVNKPVITTSETPSDGTIEQTTSPIISATILVSKLTGTSTYSTTHDSTTNSYITGQYTKTHTEVPINPTTDREAQSTLKSTMNKPVMTTSETPSDGTIVNTIISTTQPVSTFTTDPEFSISYSSPTQKHTTDRPPESTSDVPLFMCGDNSTYIPLSEVCDWKDDCPYGSDEFDCGRCSFEEGSCRYEETSVGSYHWMVTNGNSHSGPLLDHTLNSPNGYYLVADAFNTDDARGNFRKMSPATVETSYLGACSSTCTLVFWYFLSQSDGLLTVYTMQNNLRTRVWQMNFNDTEIGTWSSALIQIGRIQTKYKLIFEAVSPSGFVAVDDILMVDCGFEESTDNCISGKFHCLSGGCIYINQVCDLTDDCGDASDEDTELCGTHDSCDFEEDLCQWMNDPSGEYDWRRHQALNSTNGLGRDHTKWTSEGVFMLADHFASDVPTVASRLVTSVVFLATTSYECKIRFYFYIYGTQSGKLSLYIQPETNDDEMNAIINVWTNVGDVGQYYKKADVTLVHHHDFKLLIQNYFSIVLTFYEIYCFFIYRNALAGTEKDSEVGIGLIVLASVLLFIVIPIILVLAICRICQSNIFKKSAVTHTTGDKIHAYDNDVYDAYGGSHVTDTSLQIQTRPFNPDVKSRTETDDLKYTNYWLPIDNKKAPSVNIYI
uniref:Uncharacterized protein LOC102808787 n=1 Tax=Saccoglossus kowalevskii TaxID=10224 RepID=A0ABM0M3Y9_SACKO|nr:PREDICTED: uncharacterized protein LOC102808787 [Saccoglossus kowalevskii]